MNTQLRRHIAFALAIGIVHAGLISSVLFGMNRGFSQGFEEARLRSWFGYATAITVILLVGPRLPVRIERLVR